LKSGKVAEFDEHVGLGVVEADDGTRYPFHCTQIADGSRTIPVDAAVGGGSCRASLNRLSSIATPPL
jgi:hypothetical protein